MMSEQRGSTQNTVGGDAQPWETCSNATSIRVGPPHIAPKLSCQIGVMAIHNTLLPPAIKGGLELWFLTSAFLKVFQKEYSISISASVHHLTLES